MGKASCILYMYEYTDILHVTQQTNLHCAKSKATSKEGQSGQDLVNSRFERVKAPKYEYPIAKMADNVLVPSSKITPGESRSHQENLSKGSGEHDSLVPSHPLGIRPAGNAYSATENIKLATGALTALPDELLVQVLEFLDAVSLKRLGCACKALYAFSRLEELWKTLCIEYELPMSLFSPPPPRSLSLPQPPFRNSCSGSSLFFHRLNSSWL